MARSWTEKYLDMRYREGEFDCVHLVELVQRERFGRVLDLPKEHPRNYRDQAAMVEAYKPFFIQPTDSPVEGDAVVIVSRGHLDHIGVYVPISTGKMSEGWVLHNSRRFGKVLLTRIRDLPQHLLAVGEYGRWI